MSVLVWVHDHIVWLLLGVVPCAAAITWGLWLGRYQPHHAGGPVPERLWPLVGDPRAGSMILAEERALTPSLDWREVAHEEDWRDQTAAALAPAALDSGPGGLAWPGPDPFTWSDEVRETISPEQPAPVPYLPEPEPVRTVAGRLVETSGEWLRRLERDAGPGWTYAGTAAA